MKNIVIGVLLVITVLLIFLRGESFASQMNKKARSPASGGRPPPATSPATAPAPSPSPTPLMQATKIGADCWPVNRNYVNPFGNPTPSNVAALCTVPTTCTNHPRPKMVKMLSTNVSATGQSGTMAPFTPPPLPTGTAEQCINACEQSQTCGGFTRPANSLDSANVNCTYFPLVDTTPWFTTDAPPRLFKEALKTDATTNTWRKQPYAYPVTGIGEPWQMINPARLEGGSSGCGEDLPTPRGYTAGRDQTLGTGLTIGIVGGNSFSVGTVEDCAKLCDGEPTCSGFRRGNRLGDDEIQTCLFVTGKPTGYSGMSSMDMFYKNSAT